jgi:arginase family enzyme
LLVNIDLDVLDPHFVPSSTTPSDGGLELDQLGTLLDEVLDTGLVAALCLTSLNPLGGTRGETSSKSAWSVLHRALERWQRVPASRGTY